MLLRNLIPRNLLPYTQPIASLRCFTTTFHLTNKPLPPRLKLHDADLTISYLKGTGPGGQKIVRIDSMSLSDWRWLIAIGRIKPTLPFNSFTNLPVSW